MSTFKTLHQQLKIDESIFSKDERTLQLLLAPVYRKAAIENLRSGNGVVARNFRSEYSFCSGGNDYQKFLREQERNGTWGTYLELTSLCELLGVNAAVTPVKDGVAQPTFYLYHAPNNNAPTIHLYNSNNTHWYVNDNTLGNGNCLYNAFAQAVRKINSFITSTSLVPSTKPATFNNKTNIPIKAPVQKQSFFGTKASSEKLAKINALFAVQTTIAKQSTPTKYEEKNIDEKTRISKLSAAEQEQIKQDRILALQLAREEAENPFTRKIMLAR